MKNKQGNNWIKLILLGVCLAIFIFISSGNATAWTKYQGDTWSSGVILDYDPDFETGNTLKATASYGSDKPYGLLVMESLTEGGVVDESVIMVWQGSSNNIRAFEYDGDATLNNLDVYSAGYLKGDWFGVTLTSGSDYEFDTFGVFNKQSTSNETFFRHIGWNDSSNEFELVWNVSLGTFPTISSVEGIGTGCYYLFSEYRCLVYTDELNESGAGYGNIWEFNIDTHEIREYEFNWSNKGAGYKHPVITDFDADNRKEFLFYGNADGSGDVNLISFELDDWRLDNDDTAGNSAFSIDGISDVKVGTGANTEAPMLIDLGQQCTWNLLECASPPLFNCWSCDGASQLEIVTAYADASSDNIYAFDSQGDVISGYPVNLWTVGANFNMCGITQADCDDDGDQDIVYGFQAGSSNIAVNCINGDTGSKFANYGTLDGGTNGCTSGSGFLRAELDGDTNSEELILTGGIVSVTDWEDNIGADNIPDNYSVIKKFTDGSNFVLAEVTGDAFIDLVRSKSGQLQVYSTTQVNQPPVFIDDGAELDTCIAICVNETLTFYARQDLDYTDAEDDSAYLGVDCFGEGIPSVVWGTNDIDPQVTCNYDELGNWETTVYISDHANFPIYNESMSIGIYTALQGNCYESGQYAIECSPVILSGVDVDDDECFNDDGLSVCLFTGTSSELCDTCGCLALSQSKCFGVNETQFDGYESTLYNWDECASWNDSLFYGVCPFYKWSVSALGRVWTWIFTTFFIFLTIVLILVIGILIFKKRTG